MTNAPLFDEEKTMLQKIKWLLSIGLVFTLFACGGDGTTLGTNDTPTTEAPDNDDNDAGTDNDTPDNDTPAITLTMLSAEIFTPRCAFSGCHGGGAPAEGMSLAADLIAANIIGVTSNEQPDLKRIDPGNPAGSYLLKKVIGTDIVGSQMPLSGGPLSQEQIDRISAWIQDGAPQ